MLLDYVRIWSRLYRDQRDSYLRGFLRGWCGPFKVIEGGALEGCDEFGRRSARGLRKISKRLLQMVGRRVMKGWQEGL
jgi:hypothetical protein